VSSELDILALKPVQNAIHNTNVVVYKPIASIDRRDLEFRITADSDTYMDHDTKIYIRGKFTKADETALDVTDHTAGTNNFLHSLFSQCTIALNGVNITQSGDLYNYRAYLGTLLSYGSDAASLHLTNSYCYKDVGDMMPCGPTNADSKNTGFIDRWNRQKQSKDIEMYGRIHSYLLRSEILNSRRQAANKVYESQAKFLIMNPAADYIKLFLNFLTRNCL